MTTDRNRTKQTYPFLRREERPADVEIQVVETNTVTFIEGGGFALPAGYERIDNLVPYKTFLQEGGCFKIKSFNRAEAFVVAIDMTDILIVSASATTAPF